MKYLFTDFFKWEQVKIDQLRKEGKYVYFVIDTGGVHYNIVEKGFCNRFGFLITDEKLPISNRESMSDIEFEALNPIEDASLNKTIKDISKDLEDAKKQYEKEKRERDKNWKNIISFQDRLRSLSKERNLPAGPLSYQYENNKMMVIQGLWEEEGKLFARYFIRENGKITTQSTLLEIPYSAKKIRIRNLIAKAEGITGNCKVVA